MDYQSRWEVAYQWHCHQEIHLPGYHEICINMAVDSFFKVDCVRRELKDHLLYKMASSWTWKNEQLIGQNILDTVIKNHHEMIIKYHDHEQAHKAC